MVALLIQFIPRDFPHFRGLWESGGKSGKFYLIRVLTEVKLTYEEFLHKQRATLNSKPLYPLSSGRNNLQLLTPSYLLIGRTLTGLPDVDVRSVPITRLSRLQFIQSLHQAFWIRWSKEYMSVHQQRSKWRQHTKGHTIRSLVLLKQNNFSTIQWTLGRITEVYPDNEGVVGEASVWTTKGIYKHAITRLCPHPLTNDESERHNLSFLLCIVISLCLLDQFQFCYVSFLWTVFNHFIYRAIL